jgi:hypothetical protein
MANTLIQLKHSLVTDIPPSLNIAEPAYSYTSNVLFIGTPDGLSTVNIGGEYYTSQIDDATNSDSSGTIVRRDSDGSASFNVITANTITAEIDGNANSATQLETPRFFNFTGDVDNVSVSFNGTANADFTLELTNTGVVANTYGSTTQIPVITVDEDGRITDANTVDIATTLSLSADGSTSANVDLLSETLTIAGGDGVITTANSETDTITIDVDNTVIRTTGDQTITGNTTLSGIVSVDSNKIVDLANPTTSTDAANKAYVDEVAQGLKVRQAAWVLTDTNLASTYDPDGFETGWATLTANTVGAFPTTDGIDSTELNVIGARFLITAQDNAAHNGLYVLIEVGDESTPWKLRRCGGCRTSEQVPGSFVFVQRGTLYNDTGWVAIVDDPATFVIGVDSIGWTQFSGAGTFTAGAGLTLTGTEFSVSNTSVVAATYGASSNTLSFAVNSRGQLTSVTENIIAISTDQITSGILSVTRGGTGADTFTSNGVLLGQGNNSITTASSSTEGHVLTINDSGVPTFTMLSGGTF